MEASITLKSVAKRFNNRNLLADLSFGVEKGTTFVLIGANGAGKSTILKLLVGLIYKDTGSIYIRGQDISTRSIETRKLCGYMSQEINLDYDINIFDNLTLYCQLHGMHRRKINQNISSNL